MYYFHGVVVCVVVGLFLWQLHVHDLDRHILIVVKYGCFFYMFCKCSIDMGEGPGCKSAQNERSAVKQV